jgi:hypothetical protein
LIDDSLLLGNSVDPNNASVVRDALWADNSLLDSFIRQNPAGLPPQDLELVRTWRWRVQNTFLVVKHLKKYSIFISSEKSDSDDCKVYGVVGMSDPLEDTLVYDVPCMVKAVLIPFEGRITYDSLFVSYGVSFGRNIRGSLNRDYQEARRRRAIVEKLERAEMVLVR